MPGCRRAPFTVARGRSPNHRRRKLDVKEPRGDLSRGPKIESTPGGAQFPSRSLENVENRARQGQNRNPKRERGGARADVTPGSPRLRFGLRLVWGE